MNRYALIIDHELCWGCRTCEVACKQEMNAAEGVQLISVQENGPEELSGKLQFAYHVRVCHHCEAPPCAEACPEHAIYKRDDGVVVMDYERCTGCRTCIDACPYEAITFDMTKGIAQKCNLCYHRVDKGLLPACADNICLAHCIHLERRVPHE